MIKKLLVAAATAAWCASAGAGTIVGATGALINSGGPGFGSIANTHNQNGLFINYVSGVTDFATYLSGNPIHSLVFSGNEWFGNSQASTASVTYDLGSMMYIDKLALWNEDAAGIGMLNLFHSADGVNFFSLAAGLAPINTTLNVHYGAEVFGFGATNLRYLRMDMSGCPQPNGSFAACAIGEVAFEAVDEPNGQVPEPASLALLGIGLSALAAMPRRRA